MKRIAFYLMAVAVFFAAGCQDELDKSKFTYNVKANVEKVELNSTTLSLARNSTATLRATITPEKAINKTLLWSSSDDAVASVGETGTVTAKSTGTATITVKTEDGNKTATCDVTVTESVATRVRLYFELNSSNSPVYVTSKTIDVNEKVIAMVTVEPSNTSDKSVTWTSSNPAIATVSNGSIEGKAPGKVTITAESTNGIKGSLELTVLSRVTKVELPNEIKLVVGGTAVIKATVSPANASNKTVFWSVSSTALSYTVTNPGEVTVKLERDPAGEAVSITAVSEDGGFRSTCSVLKNTGVVETIILTDNFQYGDGYQGNIAGTKIFDVADVNIAAGSKYELEIEFTANRDFEDVMEVGLVDPSPPSYWTEISTFASIDAAATDAPYKAGATIKRKVTITTNVATTRSACNLYFATKGAGTQGTANSGVKGPVTLTFSKLEWSKK